jgi:hypothetical protein
MSPGFESWSPVGPVKSNLRETGLLERASVRTGAGASSAGLPWEFVGMEP